MTELEKMRKKAAKLTNPTPVELPSGSFRCQITVYGKRYSAVDKDPAVAHAKVNAIRSGLLEPENNVAKMTVGQAIDRYIESKNAVLSPTTIRGYNRMRKNDLQELMDVPLVALTQEAVQKAVNKMANKKSPKSVRNACGLLTASLAVYRPSFILRITLPQSRKTEISIPSTEEVNAILNSVKGTKYELPFMLAATMGLRTSEIRGLTWDCIEGDRMHIKQALVTGDNGDVLKPTKSYSGDRWLKISPQVQVLLDKRVRVEGAYLFKLTEHSMYDIMMHKCEKLGLPRYSPHDLRHYYASVLLSLGVPDKYTMERMGHSTTHMLKNVYQHTMEEKQQKVTDDIEGFFNEKIK